MHHKTKEKLDWLIKKEKVQYWAIRISFVIVFIVLSLLIYSRLISRAYSFTTGTVIEQKPFRSAKSYYLCKVLLDNHQLLEIGCDYAHISGTTLKIEQVKKGNQTHYNLAIDSVSGIEKETNGPGY